MLAKIVVHGATRAEALSRLEHALITDSVWGVRDKILLHLGHVARSYEFPSGMIWMSGTDNEITYLNQTWLDYAGRPSDAAVENLRARTSTQTKPSDAARCTKGLRAA